jgi:hypothetical protein
MIELKTLEKQYNDLIKDMSDFIQARLESDVKVDKPFDKLRDYMRSAYEEYYVGVQRLASELQGIIGHSVSLTLWIEEIDLDNFDDFFNHYVYREMSLDDITTASRVLKRLIKSKGEI